MVEMVKTREKAGISKNHFFCSFFLSLSFLHSLLSLQGKKVTYGRCGWLKGLHEEKDGWDEKLGSGTFSFVGDIMENVGTFGRKNCALCTADTRINGEILLDFDDLNHEDFFSF